jgi:hypothetical protein
MTDSVPAQELPNKEMNSYTKENLCGESIFAKKLYLYEYDIISDGKDYCRFG